MKSIWKAVARRMVAGLGVQPGELVQVRSSIDRFEVLQEILLAVELAGAVPLAEITPGGYLGRLLAETRPEYLASWDRHRVDLMHRYDRVLTLVGDRPDFAKLPKEAVASWLGATHRLTEVEEARRLPFLVVAMPARARARSLGMSLADLDAILLPALGAGADELGIEIDRVLAKAKGTKVIIRSGERQSLHLQLGNRAWMADDGYIDEADRANGAIVSNLPAGSIYTTVLEEKTHGAIAIPQAGPARQAVLHFQHGRITRVEAESGAEELSTWLDSHSGEPRRVSHFGIGLNPHLNRPTGWVIVDEHIQGNLFLALGENRYMGGQNESSLNVDYVVPGTTIEIDGRTLVVDGRVVR